MNLWSVSILIEDQFKNLFCEYCEDFDGYISSSLFLQEYSSKNKSSTLKFMSNKNINLGEFHDGEFWVLEVLLNEEPSMDIIKLKINLLAKELNIKEYKNEDKNEDKNLSQIVRFNTIKLKKVITKNWIIENRKQFPIININNFCIFGTHIMKVNRVNKISIKINASTAFGTGSHATTKCCLKAIKYLSKFYKPKKILDYGCGTGILGIASKKIFKNSTIYLVDIDKNAIKITKENLKLNNIKSNKVYLTNSFFFKEYINNNGYDLVIANILYSPLYKLTPILRYISKPKSKVILSGLLKHQIPYIINRFNNFGFHEEKKFFIDDWGSIIMILK